MLKCIFPTLRDTHSGCFRVIFPGTDTCTGSNSWTSLVCSRIQGISCEKSLGRGPSEGTPGEALGHMSLDMVLFATQASSSHEGHLLCLLHPGLFLTLLSDPGAPLQPYTKPAPLSVPVPPLPPKTICLTLLPSPQTPAKICTWTHCEVHQWSWMLFPPRALPIRPAKNEAVLYFIAVVQSLSGVWLCHSMDSSAPGFPALHYLLEFAQTHVHWVGDASNHLILCSPLLLPPPICPSLRVFSNESAHRIRWPKY